MAGIELGLQLVGPDGPAGTPGELRGGLAAIAALAGTASAAHALSATLSAAASLTGEIPVSSPTAFIPTTTTDLVGAHVAGFGETLSSGRVTTWADQHTSGNDMTGEGTYKPKSVTDGAGNPAILYDWDDDTAFDGHFSFATTGFDNRDLSVYMVIAPTRVRQTMAFFDLGGGGSVQFRQIEHSTGPHEVRFKTTTGDGLYQPCNKQVLHFQSGASALRQGINNTTYSSGAGSSGTGLDGGTIGAKHASSTGGINRFEGYIYAIYIYQDYHDATTADAIIADLITEFGVQTVYNNLAICGIDSLAAGKIAGNENAWPTKVFGQGGDLDDWLYFNVSEPGHQVGDGTDADIDYPDHMDGLEDFMLTGTTRNVCVTLGGTNDLWGGSQTAAATWTRIKEFCADRKTAGFETAVITIPDLTHAASAASTLNTSIRGGDSSIDIVIDSGKGGDSPSDRLGDYTDTGYFDGDGVHILAASHTIIAEDVAAALP